MHRHSRRTKLKMILAAIALVICAVALYQGARWLELRNQKPETRGDYTLRYDFEPTVEVMGKTYRRRANVTTILLMGVDKDLSSTGKGYRNGGQADFLRLLVLDSKAKTLAQLQIDRDTMTPIAVLGILGDRTSTRVAQISLSHAFGDGGEESGGLTAEAVSNMLLDTPVDFFIALDFEGVPVLNDWAGGVTVTLEDDFSHIDPAMVKGATITLMGEQAGTYVRSRMSVGEGTNEARMKRQQQYISQLLVQLDARISKSKSEMTSLLDALDSHLVTNMARGRMINEFWAAKDYTRLPLTEIAGEHVTGEDGFKQFHMDEADLQRKVLELFYEEVDKR